MKEYRRVFVALNQQSPGLLLQLSMTELKKCFYFAKKQQIRALTLEKMTYLTELWNKKKNQIVILFKKVKKSLK